MRLFFELFLVLVIFSIMFFAGIQYGKMTVEDSRPTGKCVKGKLR